MKKIIILSLFITLTLCGCNSSSNTANTSNDNVDIKSIMKNNDYVIIDVRTPSEYETGHVKGAINIPYDEIDENIDIDKNKTVFVYCKSGTRSKKAYDTLNSLGFTVYDLGAFDSIDLEKE